MQRVVSSKVGARRPGVLRSMPLEVSVRQEEARTIPNLASFNIRSLRLHSYAPTASLELTSIVEVCVDSITHTNCSFTNVLHSHTQSRSALSEHIRQLNSVFGLLRCITLLYSISLLVARVFAIRWRICTPQATELASKTRARASAGGRLNYVTSSFTPFLYLSHSVSARGDRTVTSCI